MVAAEQIDQWFQHLANWEVTLEEMAAASTDQNFTEELGAIEQCEQPRENQADDQGSACFPRLSVPPRSIHSSNIRPPSRSASSSASSIIWRSRTR